MRVLKATFLKRLATFAATISVVITFAACTSEQSENSIKDNTTAYDSVLAEKYGADDYGMKKYVMAFLKRGPNRPSDSLKSAELQKAHLQNIKKMAEEGTLVLAGPFLDNDELRGIYIFDVPTIDEARKLTETDPAIQHGSLVMELKPWYGSAGLMGIGAVHETITKKSFTD